MFRLEKLEISGFKSFADRTSLVFGEGITGVVGPNGCGKSNIAEAISWVLGEQSAKNLRGGKMEDVIFNGTRDRKPTGMAEVLLTLVAIEDIAARDTDGLERDDEQEYEDALTTAEQAADAARSLVQEMTPPEASTTDSNSTSETSERIEDAIGPQIEPEPIINHAQSTSDLQAKSDGPNETVDHDGASSVDRKRTRHHRKRRTIAISAGERVTVGRRLYRTGDSDYLMNGRACLLRDIQDLFAGTGLGGAHYAIIEQGRIGQILSSKPLDRRSLIEEAAGITKFKSRKRSTELKLESAKHNLSRLNDIVTEVERQLNSLKRQAQKARRYRRLREEMRSLLKIIFTADYYRLKEAAERIAREFEQAELEQRSLDARLLELEAEHRAASAQARSAQDNLTALRERAAAIELEADRARNRRAFEEQQIGEMTARIEELNRDQQALDERLALLDAETQRQATGLQELENELATGQADLLAREATHQKELVHLREAESEIDELRRRMLTEIAITERFRNLGLNLEDAVKRLDLKRTSLITELERASIRREDASSEFARAGGEVEVDARTLSEMNERIIERGADLIALREQAGAIRSQLESVRTARDAAAHRLKSLEDLDSHHAYYSDAVQQVLSREQAARINALGTLADFVEVDPQYERLIESLFARELQSVLVPTIDDALAGVEYIKQAGLGRGAFLVVGLHGGEDDSDAKRTNEDAESFEIPEDHASDNGIEDWLLGPGDTREVSPFQEQYIPEERQLAAADPTVLDAIVIHLHGGESQVISDSHVGIVSETDDREAARRFDEDAVSHASRFQLDVLRAIDLLGIKPQIKTVVERAFSEKCSAAVAPDIEAALQLSIENPSAIYVTLAGEQVAGGRLIVTGAQAGQKGTSLLGLKREIKELREQSKSVAEDESRILKDHDEAQQRLRLVEAEAAALDQQLREHEKAAAARNSHLEGLARDFERAESHVRVVESELEQNSVERHELESRIEQLTGELASAEASQEAVQQSLERAGSEFAEMRARVEDLSQQASTVRASTAALAERLNAARSEIRRAESEAEELRSRINRNRLELYDSHGRIEALTTSLEEGVDASARLERDQASLVETIAVASEELTFSRTRTDELEKTLGELRQATAAAHDRRGQIEVGRARIESEAAHLTKTCFAELAMSLEDVVTSVELTMEQSSVAGGQLPAESDDQSTNEAEWSASDHLNDVNEPATGHRSPATDVDSSRARYDELRIKIDEMGPVNMMALEELEESDRRFRFLTEQRRDILDSIKMTEEALAEIKRRSRERFRHAFIHINENFQRMFVELFGGGRGEMTLIDEDDVLESGIDLIAQPPGKRLQNVLLLSGGEKAMAAIALVLAIFQYRPSPFCILDEVDAPLDEVNVGRFAGKVIEMSSETQFLVITHNKRTMEAARALYGVTMEELGVSKLVSVKFD